MNKPFLAAMMLALSASFAMAKEDSNVTTKAMKDHPGTMGGATSTPTAKPNSGSLSEKQMQDQPGVNSDTKGMTRSQTMHQSPERKCTTIPARISKRSPRL